MQTAFLVFIVIFALAIGFFLGLFLLSLNSPLLKKLFQKDESALDGSLSKAGDGAVQLQVKKPSPDAKLILQVWKESDKSPVYDIDGTYFEKERLPRDILNIITITEGKPIQQEPVLEPIIEKKPVVVEPETGESEIGSEPEIKLLSVVDEVNEILQRKLHGSPLAGKGIHLMENHHKEIRFWVGLNSYNDVEEIPDSEVRQIIDEAVREWEVNRV